MLQHKKYYEKLEIVNIANGTVVSSVILRNVQLWQASTYSWEIYTTDQELITYFDSCHLEDFETSENENKGYLHLNLTPSLYA